MYVILPRNSNAERLRTAQRLLTGEKIEKLISQMVLKTAVILFPKMHLTSSHYLKAALKNLGLRTLFEPYTSDLSVMSEGGSQRVNANRVTNNYQPTTQHPAPISVSQSFASAQASSSSQTSRDPFSGNRVVVQPQSTFDPKEHLIFGRISSDTATKTKTKRDVRYKVKSEDNKRDNPLTIKDFMLRKRIVKKNQGKKLRRSKRQFMPLFAAERLDMIRHRKDLINPQLFAEEVIHKVDLTINEKGTEGGAATAITLNRSGTSVVFRVDVPFMFLIRHDPTHVPLFYGVVFEPKN